jgi:hypothetical protein
MARIGGGSAVIVGVEGDLLVARAAGERPVEDFSEFVNLVPDNDAPFDWAVQHGLALLFY